MPVNIDALVLFALASAAIVIVPGPTVTVIVANSLNRGARAGLMNIVGTQLGLASMLILLALGFGSLVTRMGPLFEVVRVLGAIYLVWLGVTLWRANGGTLQQDASVGTARALGDIADIKQGFIVIWANPKALVLAPLLWGGNAVAGKLSTSEWGPFILTSLRWAFASIILIALAWKIIRGDWAVIRQHLPFLFALGALGMAGFNLLMYLALQTTTAINASIIQSVAPCMIMLANFVFFHQRVRALQILGLLVSILGVVLVTTSGRPMGLLEGDLAATVFAIDAVVARMVGVVIHRDFSDDDQSAGVATWR